MILGGDKRIDIIEILYYKIVDELLNQEEKSLPPKANSLFNTLYMKEFHKAAFTCSAETVLFVYNEQKLLLQQLMKNLRISSFDVWKLINSFIVFDPQMPTPLKRHFRDIEVKIVSQLGWESDSPVIKIISKMLEDMKEE